MSIVFLTLALVVPFTILARIKSSNECTISIIIIPVLYILSAILIHLYMTSVTTTALKVRCVMIIGIGLLVNEATIQNTDFILPTGKIVIKSKLCIRKLANSVNYIILLLQASLPIVLPLFSPTNAFEYVL